MKSSVLWPTRVLQHEELSINCYYYFLTWKNNLGSIPVSVPCSCTDLVKSLTILCLSFLPTCCVWLTDVLSVRTHKNKKGIERSVEKLKLYLLSQLSSRPYKMQSMTQMFPSVASNCWSLTACLWQFLDFPGSAFSWILGHTRET